MAEKGYYGAGGKLKGNVRNDLRKLEKGRRGGLYRLSRCSGRVARFLPGKNGRFL